MHPEFVPIAVLSATSVLLILPWHWRAGNIATLSLAFWLFISNLIYGVDAAIWRNSVVIIVPVWCDITTKLIIGANFALPASCLCICIHLERVASVRLAKSTISDKRRRQLFEAVMCIGLPIIFMGLHFIVQGHRFDIIEYYGCRPTTYFSIVSIFIVWLPPLLMSIAALIFAALALRHFMLRRVSFAAHLHGTNSALTTSRYLRLMLMAAVQMIWGVTTSAYAIWFTVIGIPLRPWTTWADVHSDFHRIDQYPAILTPPKVAAAYCVLWWMVPISTWIFVAFFAFGKDAVDEYKKCFVWFRVHVLRQTVSTERKKYSFMDSVKSKWIKSKAEDSSITITTVSTTITSPPPYVSPNQFKHDTAGFPDDSRSEISQYYPQTPYTPDLKPSRSLSQLTTTPLPTHTHFIGLPNTASDSDEIPLTPITPPEAFPPPRRHPRVLQMLEAQQNPTSPRPFTYPSNESSHREIHYIHDINPTFP